MLLPNWKVLYTDNEYNVLFPEDNAGENIKSKSTIYSLTGQIAEEKVTIGENGTVSISSAGEYVSFINQAKDNSANKESYTINLTSNINLMGADSSLGEIKDADITINGNNHTIEFCDISDVCSEVDDQGARLLHPLQEKMDERHCHVQTRAGHLLLCQHRLPDHHGQGDAQVHRLRPRRQALPRRGREDAG